MVVVFAAAIREKVCRIGEAIESEITENDKLVVRGHHSVKLDIVNILGSSKRDSGQGMFDELFTSPVGGNDDLFSGWSRGGKQAEQEREKCTGDLTM